MLCAAVSGALVAAAPLTAQETAAAADEDSIVVTGERDREPPTNSEVSRQARAITRARNLRDLPLPRFQDRLCPGVIGLRPEHAALIIDRIRFHAQQLDMWLTEDDGTCSPNLIVAFVNDGKAELARLEDEHPSLFQTLPLFERRELLAEDGPVRVWTTTATRTRDGMPVARNEGGAPPTLSTWMAHSKIYLSTREDITSVVVLFDLQDMLGMTLVQLADYATMRGLAKTRPVDDDGQALETILALFDPQGSRPPQMTEFDRAYLAAVYDGIPNIPGVTKVLDVNRQLRRQGKAEAEE